MTVRPAVVQGGPKGALRSGGRGAMGGVRDCGDPEFPTMVRQGGALRDPALPEAVPLNGTVDEFSGEKAT